jgi:hypothetical protein
MKGACGREGQHGLVRFGIFRTANDVLAHAVVPARRRHRPPRADPFPISLSSTLAADDVAGRMRMLTRARSVLHANTTLVDRVDLATPLLLSSQLATGPSALASAQGAGAQRLYALAHRDNSLPRSNLMAFGADRTSSGRRDRRDQSRLTRFGHACRSEPISSRASGCDPGFCGAWSSSSWKSSGPACTEEWRCGVGKMTAIFTLCHARR